MIGVTAFKKWNGPSRQPRSSVRSWSSVASLNRPATIWPENAAGRVDAPEAAERRVDEALRGLGVAEVPHPLDDLHRGAEALELADEPLERIPHDEVVAAFGQHAGQRRPDVPVAVRDDRHPPPGRYFGHLPPP